MNERIKELAEQAGFEFDAECVEGWIAEDEHIERFAELIRQDEREACAKLCEKFIGEDKYDMFGNDLAEQCAAAIRARGEK